MADIAESIAPVVPAIPFKRIPLPSSAATEAASVLGMIERASASGASVEQIERMFALYEKASARAAQSSFIAAMMRAKTAMPRIIKTGTIEGNVKDSAGAKVGKAKQSTYARWEEVCQQIEPVLAANDLVLTFQTEQSQADRVSVTAILTHIDGHQMRSQMSLPIDTGGAKNNVQGWGSSVSYGKRYTAFAVLNLVGHDDNDKDGADLEPETISEDQQVELRDLIDAKEADIQRFCTYFKIDKIGDLKVADFERAKTALKAKS
jgi:hypothetical protein